MLIALRAHDTQRRACEVQLFPIPSWKARCYMRKVVAGSTVQGCSWHLGRGHRMEWNCCVCTPAAPAADLFLSLAHSCELDTCSIKFSPKLPTFPFPLTPSSLINHGSYWLLIASNLSLLPRLFLCKKLPHLAAHALRLIIPRYGCHVQLPSCEEAPEFPHLHVQAHLALPIFSG